MGHYYDNRECSSITSALGCSKKNLLQRSTTHPHFHTYLGSHKKIGNFCDFLSKNEGVPAIFVIVFWGPQYILVNCFLLRSSGSKTNWLDPTVPTMVWKIMHPCQYLRPQRVCFQTDFWVAIMRLLRLFWVLSSHKNVWHSAFVQLCLSFESKSKVWIKAEL